MPATISVDGVEHTVELLPDGVIRVSHEQPQMNAMHGIGTDSTHVYHVHRCQRHQFEFWSRQLPAEERAAAAAIKDEERPWWSAGPNQSSRERD